MKILKYIFSTFFIIIIVVLSFLLFDKKNNHIEIDDEVISTNSEKERLSPNAEFFIKKYYDECSHYELNSAELPVELVNMSRQEIEDYYDDLEIEEFSINKLVLVKEINGYCNNHYIIKLDDGIINVYKINTLGDLKLYKNTGISKEYLTNEDILKLQEGIEVYGKNSIIEILEDLE